jgi:hypothetical protein
MANAAPPPTVGTATLRAIGVTAAAIPITPALNRRLTVNLMTRILSWVATPVPRLRCDPTAVR